MGAKKSLSLENTMIDESRVPEEILKIVKERLQGRTDEINFPPPVFDALKGEIVSYQKEEETLTNRFPVLDIHLNPYGAMQGGIISAAIDNTIGPLSLLVSPPNFTRYMDVKYARVVTPDLGYIYVTAKYIAKKKRFLYFEAVVLDCDDNQLASAKSTHWVL